MEYQAKSQKRQFLPLAYHLNHDHQQYMMTTITTSMTTTITMTTNTTILVVHFLKRRKCYVTLHTKRYTDSRNSRFLV